MTNEELKNKADFLKTFSDKIPEKCQSCHPNRNCEQCNLKQERKNAINEIKNGLRLKESSNEPKKAELFRFACYVGSWRRYAYYISAFNHLLVLEKIDDDFEKEIKFSEIENKYQYEQLELHNGYIQTAGSKKFENVVYSTETDVYKYVELAGWLTQEDYDKAVLLSADNKDRIEVHHINGNSADNSVSNLIYIPNTIHHFIHSKQ